MKNLDLLPNVVFVGAEKSGSTTIHRVLSKHPDIFTIPKETEFFTFYKKDKKRSFFINNLDDYNNLYNKARGKKIRLDVSTTYLHSNYAINTIKSFINNPKIIICLRNPIDRAYSRYWMSAKINHDLVEYSAEKFKNYFNNHKTDIGGLNVRNRGLYFEHVDKYIKKFGSKNVLVLFYDDLIKNNVDFFNTIYSFLNINKINIEVDIYADSLISKKNIINKFFNLYLINEKLSALVPGSFKKILRFLRRMILDKYPIIGHEERIFLKDFYINDIKKLEKLLNKDLGGWLR